MPEGYIYDKEHETMDRDALEELQLKKLKNTVNRCYEKIPMYREKFDEAGVTPDDINSLDDLDKIPFTTKNDLREAWPYEMMGVDQTDIHSLHCSSGTTGKPTLAPFTPHDIEIWGRAIARCLAMMGVKPGDVFQNAYGYGLFTGGLGFHYGCQEIGASVIPMSGGRTGRQVELAMDLNATSFCCTPSFASHIGAYIRDETDIDPEELPWQAGSLGAEPCTDELRKEIEERLDITYFDVYGLSEITGPGVAHECSAHEGSHFMDDFWIPEIVDPDTGERLPEGEEGELVLTTLEKEAQPMLRFRTGDITSLTKEKCACGRTTSRTGPEMFVARVDDMLKVKGAKFWPSTVEDAIVSVKGASENYRLIVDRPKDVDILKLRFEPTKKMYDEVSGDLSKLEDLKKKVYSSFRDKTMTSLNDIELVGYGELERFSGKGHSAKVEDRREVGVYG